MVTGEKHDEESKITGTLNNEKTNPCRLANELARTAFPPRDTLRLPNIAQQLIAYILRTNRHFSYLQAASRGHREISTGRMYPLTTGNIQ